MRPFGLQALRLLFISVVTLAAFVLSSFGNLLASERATNGTEDGTSGIILRGGRSGGPANDRADGGTAALAIRLTTGAAESEKGDNERACDLGPFLISHDDQPA